MDSSRPKQATSNSIDRTEIVIRQGDEIRKLQMVTSPEPLDPTIYAGWWTFEVNIGHVGIRLVI